MTRGAIFVKHAEERGALLNVHANLPIDDEQMPDLYNLADTVIVPSMRCSGTNNDRSPNI